MYMKTAFPIHETDNVYTKNIKIFMYNYDNTRM